MLFYIPMASVDVRFSVGYELAPNEKLSWKKTMTGIFVAYLRH